LLGSQVLKKCEVQHENDASSRFRDDIFVARMLRMGKEDWNGRSMHAVVKVASFDDFFQVI